MTTETLMLEVPGPLYEQLRQRADQAHRSVEEETLEVLATTMPADGPLPADLSAAVESLKAQDDGALWGAVQTRLADETSAELETLHHKRQREGLTEAESRKRSELVGQYERHMLMRAQAIALLRERGHDVSSLVDE